MVARVNKDICMFCGGCISVCSFMALELKETNLMVDEGKCTNCGTCERFCPVGAIKVEK